MIMKFKQIICVFAMLTIMFVSIPVEAKTLGISEAQPRWTAITERCTSCGSSVRSYGINENDSNRNFSFNEGERCEYCNQIVPEGYVHQTHKTRDLYYFQCRCGNNWTSLGDWHYFYLSEDIVKL